MNIQTKNYFIYLFSISTNRVDKDVRFSNYRYMKKILEERLPYLPLQTCKDFKDVKEAHHKGNLTMSLMESSYCQVLNECFTSVLYDVSHKNKLRPDFDFTKEKLFLEVKSDLQTVKDIEKSYLK